MIKMIRMAAEQSSAYFEGGLRPPPEPPPVFSGGLPAPRDPPGDVLTKNVDLCALIDFVRSRGL